MKKKIKNILSVTILSLFVFSCGFKPINQRDNKLIYFKNINIVGEQRVSYLIKNNLLLISDNDSENKYNVLVTITKDKNSKIKNTAGRVTRYTLSLKANLELTNLADNNELQKTFVRTADFNVENIHSDTISNQNRVTKNLVQQLSDDITNFISLSTRYK
jgi:hypothetical protein